MTVTSTTVPQRPNVPYSVLLRSLTVRCLGQFLRFPQVQFHFPVPHFIDLLVTSTTPTHAYEKSRSLGGRPGSSGTAPHMPSPSPHSHEGAKGARKFRVSVALL